jgi:hypothetical protein
MKQPDPKPLGYKQHPDMRFSLYLGGIGIATVTVQHYGLGKDGVMESRGLYQVAF